MAGKRHEKIAEILRSRITSGELRPRQRLPSQKQMTTEFNTSNQTISRAIADLRARRYVWTLPHKGSYARPPEDWEQN
ncbi:winged helix-turn-helix domain-containing protein [Actinoallomurus spadix]